jgi:hypothetical protein
MTKPAKLMQGLLLFVLLNVTVSGCATTGNSEDPLRNTKKLVTEGHVSLYKNGAFRVPNTSISLIPPGPSTLEFVQELAGMRARQSFETSIEKAAASVYVVSAGANLTFEVSKNISESSNAGADAIRSFSREHGTVLVYRSSDLGKDIVGSPGTFEDDVFVRQKAGTPSFGCGKPGTYRRRYAAGTGLARLRRGQGHIRASASRSERSVTQETPLSAMLPFLEDETEGRRDGRQPD